MLTLPTAACSVASRYPRNDTKSLSAAARCQIRSVHGSYGSQTIPKVAFPSVQMSLLVGRDPKFLTYLTCCDTFRVPFHHFYDLQMQCARPRASARSRLLAESAVL